MGKKQPLEQESNTTDDKPQYKDENKSLIDTIINKVRKQSKEEITNNCKEIKEHPMQDNIDKEKEEMQTLTKVEQIAEKEITQKIEVAEMIKEKQIEKEEREQAKENEKKIKEDEKRRDEEAKEIERQREKQAREEELKKRALKDLEEEKKRQREKEKRDEKERQNLVRIEKERQAKELKELKAKKKEISNDQELIYADDDDQPEKACSPPACAIKSSEEEKEEKFPKGAQLYEPVGPNITEPLVAETSHNEIEEKLGLETVPVSPSPEMALSARSPGEVDNKKYVSVVSSDDFNTFQQNGYHDDEDIDFTPQNGYLEPEDMDTQVNQGTAMGKKAGAPKMDLMGKLAAAGSAIKNARLPSPGEIKEGYLNSAFHKSLHQPLMVKSKVEKTDVQKARQAITQEKTPAQLGNIESLSDIPVPTIRKSKGEKMETEDEEPFHFPTNMEEFGQAAYNTLPKSMKEQNIITAVKENSDPEELERNRTLTQAKTPAELAQINSLAEFPVPEKIKHLFERRETEP